MTEEDPFLGYRHIPGTPYYQRPDRTRLYYKYLARLYPTLSMQEAIERDWEKYTMQEQEVRVTDPRTGGQKGSKLARFDMIPADVMWELAEHYGKGEAKYPSDEDGPNWQKGFRWSLSVAALERHLALWKRGQAEDEETGTHHLVAVIWHAIALRWFEKRGRGTDDRVKDLGQFLQDVSEAING